MTIGSVPRTQRPSCGAKKNEKMQHPTYFLIVSSLVRYKRIDLAIEACSKLGKHLKIVGEGADRKRLEQLVRSRAMSRTCDVEFCGWKQGEDLASLFAEAQATIFAGDEDFGLVPLESMACGTPVIAYRSGGALETIIEHQTGEFFDEPTAQSLQKVLQNFDSKKYSGDACREQARNFSRSEFEKKMKEAVDTLMFSRG